jgi:hypothetical protein
MAAKIPHEMMKRRSRKLSDLAVGEAAYVYNWEMRVLASGEAYLAPTAELAERGPCRVLVERREDGMHVTLIGRSSKWAPVSQEAYIQSSHIPAATVAEDYDPEFDEDAIVGKFEQVAKRLKGLEDTATSKA